MRLIVEFFGLLVQQINDPVGVWPGVGLLNPDNHDVPLGIALGAHGLHTRLGILLAIRDSAG